MAMTLPQPPSGGCVLIQASYAMSGRPNRQPPSGGCVLKQASYAMNGRPNRQPPSGGCVLKRWGAWFSPLAVGSHLRVAVC